MRYRHRGRRIVAVLSAMVLGLVGLGGAQPAHAEGLSGSYATSSVTVGSYPTGVAVDPDGTTALVVNQYGNGGAAQAGTVSVLTKSGSGWNTTSTVTVGYDAQEVAITPDGNTALVTCWDSYMGNDPDAVWVLTRSGSSWAVSGTVPVGSGPSGVAITPDGATAFVTNGGDNTVSVLTGSGSSWAVSGTVPVGSGPSGVAVSPDGATAFVTNGGDNTVSVLTRSGTTWSATTTLAVGPSPNAAVATPDGSTVLVLNSGNNTVSMVTRSGSGWKVSDQRALGSDSHTSPAGIALTPDGATAFVTNSFDHSSGNYATAVTVAQWSVLTPGPQTLSGSPGSAMASKPLTATNFSGPVSYSLQFGQTLPDGLSLDPSTGVVSGTPTKIQDETGYTIRGTDGTHTATATVVIAVNPVTSFADVPAGSGFSREIMWLAGKGVTTGWLQPDGTRLYKPLDSIHRDAMAAYLYRLAGSPAGYTAPTISPFTDLKPTDQFYKEICWLRAQGITTGFPDGTYRPLDPVNRDAMAAFLYRFDHSPVYTAPSTSTFVDIRPGDAFYKEICWLSSQLISTGYPDGTFGPVAPVARDAMAAFLYRLENGG